MQFYIISQASDEDTNGQPLEVTHKFTSLLCQLTNHKQNNKKPLLIELWIRDDTFFKDMLLIHVLV